MTIIDDKTVAPAARKWPALIPLTVAIVIVAAWVGNLTYTANGGNLGYIAGASFSASLIIWLVLYFAFVQKTGRRVGAIYWGVLFATGIGAGLAVSRYETIQVRNATLGIAHSYNAVLNGKTPDLSAHAAGDIGQVEAWLNSYRAVQMEDRKAYERELDGAGVPDLLRPEHLKADHNFSESRAAVVRGRAIVEKYHALYDRRVSDAYLAVDKTTMSPSMKAQTKLGIDETKATWKSVSDRMWSLEASAINEVGDILNLLDRNRSTWSITDKLVFRNRDMLESYNAHVVKLQEISKDEDELRAKAQASTRGKLTQLDALTK